MNDLPLYQQMEMYFSRKVKERSDLLDLRPLDGSADSRAEMSQTIFDPEHIKYVSHLSSESILDTYALDYPLFEYWISYDSVLVSLDDQQEILWIDDPWNDDDFSYFLRKERFFERGFNALQLANLICMSKLNYLMYRTIVISHARDIPLADHQKTFFYRLKLMRFQRRFGICPPRLMVSGGLTYLGFYLKTIGGKIIKLYCTWDGSRFAYSGEVLGKGIGVSVYMI